MSDTDPNPTMPWEMTNFQTNDFRIQNIGLDPFGIRRLYRAASAGFNVFDYGLGFEYYSTLWSRNTRYEFIPDNSYVLDDDIMHYKKTEGASCVINGDGRISIYNDTPNNFRMWLYDGDQLNAGVANALTNITSGRRWSDSLEFTFYFNRKINSEQPNHSDNGGIFIHLGSDHLFGASTTLSTSSCPFNAHEYILAIQNNGSMYFYGEPYHGSRRVNKPDDVDMQDFWGTDLNGIPTETNIGIKFVKKVVDYGKSVLLECFRDMTDGQDGGQWTRLFEFKHQRGNWYNDTMDAPYQASLSSTECVLRPPLDVDEPHYQGGGSACYMVITPVRELELKWLSCRDIQNDVRKPLTSSTDLTESGVSAEVCTRQ